MRVSSTEIQNNFGKYIQLAETQSIYIEKKGSDSIYKLQKVDKKEMLNDILNNLYGCLKGSGLENVDVDGMRYQIIKEKHSHVTYDEKEKEDEKKKGTPWY